MELTEIGCFLPKLGWGEKTFHDSASNEYPFGNYWCNGLDESECNNNSHECLFDYTVHMCFESQIHEKDHDHDCLHSSKEKCFANDECEYHYSSSSPDNKDESTESLEVRCFPKFSCDLIKDHKDLCIHFSQFCRWDESEHPCFPSDGHTSSSSDEVFSPTFSPTVSDGDTNTETVTRAPTPFYGSDMATSPSPTTSVTSVPTQGPTAPLATEAPTVSSVINSIVG